MRVTLWSPTDKFLSKRRRPSRTHQVEALAEAIIMIQSSPHGVPCVWSFICVDVQRSLCMEISELTPSIPSWVTDRATTISGKTLQVYFQVEKTFFH